MEANVTNVEYDFACSGKLIQDKVILVMLH